MEDRPSDSEPLYDAHISVGAATDFGFPLAALLSGAPPPPGGARFDVTFHGTVEGRLAGTLSGVDHLYVRADGRIELHIHARIVTSDGAPLSFSGEGVAIPDPGGGFHLFDRVVLHSSDPRLLWVNGLPVWGRGTIDLARGEIRAVGFTGSGLPPRAGGLPRA